MLSFYYPRLILFALVTVLAGACSHSIQNNEPQTLAIDTIPLLPADSIYFDLDLPRIAQQQHRLDSTFNRLVRLTGFNGVVLFAEKGRLVYQKALGFSDVRKRRDSLTIDSQFELASVSKMFTAAAIMLLKQDGLLDYDTDIRKYIPEWPYEGVTVRLLLNHRSGLSRYQSLAHEEWKDKTIPLTNEKMIALFVEYQPSPYFKPNRGFHYCNTNYALLASVVERVSGMPFEDFMEKRLFRPLGMTHSKIYNMRNDTVVSAYIDLGVPGYDHRGWRPIRVRNDYLNGVMGDKNMFSTVGDLYRFNLALDYGTLIGDSLLKEAFTPGSPRHRRRADNYGFGWRIRGNADSTVYHYGWWKGFRSFFLRDMQQQKTLIVLTNKDRGPGSDNFWNIINDTSLSLYPASVNLGYDEKKEFW
ncbi:MAG: serine hydrolase [Bacteroidetes bacterium]|jgi:CubicO group peptidase (beta-lactamase class C family)|nr:serine hydrolase [Bacteroidota bacterium]